MGFPGGYTDILLPRLLINILSLLDFLHTFTLTFLNLIGLAGLIEPVPALSIRPEYPSASAILIREMLPLERVSVGPDGPSSCAVCLYEYEEGEEIRRMRNCQHMFHKSCVDRWIDLDNKTCPLCRKQFVPRELEDYFNHKLWDVSAITDFSYSEYYNITHFL